MDLIRVYYYTSVPLLTCNTLFYAMSALSTSITSSQNVFKFISEHKDCDSILFKKEIEICDLQNKLDIIESLILDVVKRYSKTKEEYEQIKTNILSPIFEIKEISDYSVIEQNIKLEVLDRIEEPLKISLISTSDIVQNINITLENIYDKIKNHKNSYLNKLVTLCLQIELNNLRYLTIHWHIHIMELLGLLCLTLLM